MHLKKSKVIRYGRQGGARRDFYKDENNIMKSNLLAGICLLMVLAFASCDKDENYAMQHVGYYQFSTIEICQFGNWCEDTINFDGSIQLNGQNKLKIVYKLPGSSVCNTPINNGTIDVDIDEDGLLANSNNPYEDKINFKGNITKTGEVYLHISRAFWGGGYYHVYLSGVKK